MYKYTKVGKSEYMQGGLIFRPLVIGLLMMVSPRKSILCLFTVGKSLTLILSWAPIEVLEC